jgi:chorismate mutase
MENRGLNIDFMQGARDTLNARQMVINNENKAREMQMLGEQQAFNQGIALEQNARAEEMHATDITAKRQKVFAEVMERVGAYALEARRHPPGSPQREEAIANMRGEAKLTGLPLPEEFTDSTLDQMISASSAARERIKIQQEVIKVPIDDKGTVETRAPGATGAYDVVLGRGNDSPANSGGGAGGRPQQTTFVDAETGAPLIFDPRTGQYSKAQVVNATPAPKPTNPGAGEREKNADLNVMLAQANEIDTLFTANPSYVGMFDNTFGAVTAKADPKETEFRRLVTNIGDVLLRMRSGAAITEGEYTRLQKMVPNLNALTTEAQFRGQLDGFKKELQLVIDERKKAQTLGGVADRSGATKLPQGNGAKLTDKAIIKQFIDAAGSKEAGKKLAQQNGWTL